MEKEPLRHNSRGGRFRDTFLVGPNKDHVAKVPKDKIDKQTPFGKVSYPGPAYTLLKFGNTNVNIVDFENYQALPEIVKKEFAPKNRLLNGIIVQERVFDYDGTPSLSVSEYADQFGKISNKNFWNKVEELKEIFLKEKEPLLGVFADGSNVLVKKLSEEEWVPIIVDFKRLGARAYVFQPHLRLPGEVQKRFLRRFERFERNYKA